MHQAENYATVLITKSFADLQFYENNLKVSLAAVKWLLQQRSRGLEDLRKLHPALVITTLVCCTMSLKVADIHYVG